jgi:diadenylate cyclase
MMEKYTLYKLPLLSLPSIYTIQPQSNFIPLKPLATYILAPPAPTWLQVLDLLLFVLLSYQFYQLIKGTIAVKILIGFLSLLSLGWLAKQFNMPLLANLLTGITTLTTLVTLILFQYEIRKLLSSIGSLFLVPNKKWVIPITWRKKKEELAFSITSIVEASKMLAGSNTGGLIVLSSNHELKFYIETGERLDALISKRLLLAIFNKESPLHDGAIIVYQGKIIAARCILPVTERQNIPANLGLRHRAAIGMSEITDTLVIVVSEETGQISISRKGTLEPNISTQELRLAINEYLKG